MKWNSIIISCSRAFLLLAWMLPSLAIWAGPYPNAPTPFEAAAPPNWTVNPADFEYSMNMVVRMRYNGVANNNPGNVLGVFVGSSLRGVATPVINGGLAYYFVTVYSNVYSGETLNFKVYYAPDDLVYATPENGTFRHHKTLGSIPSPFWVNIDPNADFPPALLPIPPDTTLQNIAFDPVVLANYLISLDGDPVTWSALPGPNLNANIVNGVLTVTPVSGVWIGTDMVRIIVTENTANQFADTVFASFTVLPDYGPPVLQPIPNQTIFQGGAFTSFDLDNYLVFNGPCRQFKFDVFPFTGSAVDPAWPIVLPGVQPMTVVARPLFANVQLAGAGAKLAAFVNGVLAGSASSTGVAPNISYSLVLRNVGAGPITFKFFHAPNQYLYEKTTSLIFAAGGSVGTVSAPYLLQLSPLLPTLAPSGVVQIAIVDPTWLGAYPIDFIVWDCNYPLQRRDTMQAIYSIVSDNRPEITSPSTVNFQENACSVLYDTQTSDPNDSEGAGLTYTLAGGADAARFSINATTGVLSWATGFSPDFEIPADANMDNMYQVDIRVTNLANLSDTLPLTVTITNQLVEPFAVSINNGAGTICTSNAVTLQAAGAVSYVWSNGATNSSIVVNAPGTYTVTGTSTGACTAAASVLVAPPPSISASGSNAPVCVGAIIQLGSTPSGGTLPYATFAWSGPNGFSSTVEDPPSFTAVPASAGVYTVLVTDAAGCTATATTTISVTGGSAPMILAMNNGPLCVGAGVMLTSTPSGGSGVYTQYQWTGPNNYSAAVRNPAAFTAVAASAGVYMVTLTDNAGCTGVGNTTLIVQAKPIIVAGSNSPLSVGGTILLNSTPSGGSGSGYTFVWSGPNSFNSTLEDPIGFPATLAAAGVYSVTVTDSNGCTGTSSTTVVVAACPTITATLAGPVCVGGMIALQSTPVGGVLPYSSFSWAGPNGFSSTVEDPPGFQALPASAGTYTVTVTDQLGCTASASTNVVINLLPSISATNTSPVCQGADVSLSSTPSGGSGVYSGFLWTGPDNYFATLEDPAAFSTTLASAGVYQVKVTDSNGCTATTTTTVTVKPKPGLSTSSNAPVCLGSTLFLQSTPTGGSGGYTFNWTGPASFTSTIEDPSRSPVILTYAGIYRLTVTDNVGCSNTSTAAVSVTNAVGPSITATSNSPICGGSNLALSSTATGGTIPYTAYSWAGPNSFTSIQRNPTPFQVYPNATGTYTVTVTDTQNCQATASVAVVVNGPAVMASSNSPVCPGTNILLSAGAVISGATYLWSGPGSYSSTLRNPTGFIGVSGTYSVTVTLSGCSNVGSVMVTVGDNVPPMITCPANKTVSANATCSGTVGTHTALSVSDNCAANPTVTQSPIASTALNGHNDARTVTLTANDGNGNTATCTFTVTLKDVTPPVVTCPANVTIAASSTCSGVMGAYSPLTLSDNCTANPTVTQSPVASTTLSGHNDFRTVSLTADDGNGNTASCTFTVTLKDVTKPTITCPANMTVAADANCSGVVGTHSAVSVADNCNPNPTVTQSPGASTVLSGHNDVETVTLTADDGNGNTEFCTFTVTLKDITKPSITCPANTTLAADANCSGVVGVRLPVAVSDNCTLNPVVTQTPAPSTVLSGHNDVETVTLTADDGNGNTESCSFTLTLKDVTKPVIICPANMTVAADVNCSGVVGAHAPISVSDNCTSSPTVTQSPAPSTVLSGHNDFETVTLTADDGNGNTEFCTFTVTLKDVTKPTITCPANMTVAADANCNGVVGAHSAISVADNCNPNPTVTQSPAPSTVLSGHNDVETVTLTANDGNGNTEFCTFTVTLKDITKPTITCPANTTLSAGPTCTSLLGAYTAVSVADNCTANPAVTQSPPATTLLSGHNDFRTVTLTADDGNGNTQTCNFTVTLKDITAPTVLCKAHTALLDANGNTSITTANVYLSGADNCGTVNQVSVIPNMFNCSNLGANIVTLTVNDGNGNTASCTATVTVVDNIPPMVVCKVKVDAVLNAGGLVTITPADAFLSGSDNCGTVNLVSIVPSVYNCTNLGNNAATLTVNDGNGNTATCTTNVVVVDLLPPTMICQNATLNLNANGQATLTVAAINNGSFDNCTITTFVLSQTLYTCANLGTSTVTLTGTDQSGNSSTCSASVTVRDLIAPVARCKNITANLGANGNVVVPPASVDNISTDNCSFTLTLTPNTFSCANIGINTVTLRATDGSNNSSTCLAIVTVRDITPPILSCNNPTVFLNNVGQGTLTLAQVDNGSTDNCGISTRTLSKTLFNCSDIGAAQNVFMTATDGSGNTSICTASVTIRDNIAPTAVCQNVTVQLGANGTVAVYSATLAANSVDNCAVWTYSPAVRVYTTANLGQNNLTITVRDYSNNAASCVSVVTVMPHTIIQDKPLQHDNPPDSRANDVVSSEVNPEELDMLLFPNPSAGDANLQFQLPTEQEFLVRVFDMAGRQVYRHGAMGFKGENIVFLRMEAMPKGLYVVELKSGQWQATKQLVLLE